MNKLTTILTITIVGMGLNGCMNKEERREQHMNQTMSERMPGAANEVEGRVEQRGEKACLMMDERKDCQIERLKREAKDVTK